MPINGTNLIDRPIETIFSPFTNLFRDTIGFGETFFLLILIFLTFGIYIKTEDMVVTSLFMISSGAVLGTGGLFSGAPVFALVFYIFAAIGIAIPFINLFMQR